MTLRERLEAMPPGSLIPRDFVLEHLEAPARELITDAAGPEPLTWREKLWTVPAETRIGVHELAEAVNRSRDWVYRHTSSKADPDDRLPHRKLDGELVFVVQELRDWIRGHEDVIHVPRGMLQAG